MNGLLLQQRLQYLSNLFLNYQVSTLQQIFEKHFFLRFSQSFPALFSCIFYDVFRKQSFL